MHTNNDLFKNAIGEFPILHGPKGKEDIISAFSRRHHVFFQVKYRPGELKKIHVNLEGIAYLSTVSDTAFILDGHLRGNALKKVEINYDSGDCKGAVRFIPTTVGGW